MDTGTHTVMGVALGGLATLDPAVQQDPVLFNAVFIGTMIGSQAPDLDTVLKLRNNAVYIRNHRGITHSIPAILLWGIGLSGGYTFLILYFVIILYYLKRYFDKRQMVKEIQNYYTNVEQIVTSPTIRHNIWRIAITTRDHFYVGRAENGHIEIIDQFYRKPLPDIPIMDKAIQDENLDAFLSFSPVYRWEIDEFDDYTEVRFIDLRYRSKGRYPFVAVVTLDDDHNILSSYTGWIFSEEKLQKKLDAVPT